MKNATSNGCAKIILLIYPPPILIFVNQNITKYNTPCLKIRTCDTEKSPWKATSTA